MNNNLTKEEFDKNLVFAIRVENIIRRAAENGMKIEEDEYLANIVIDAEDFIISRSFAERYEEVIIDWEHNFDDIQFAYGDLYGYHVEGSGVFISLDGYKHNPRLVHDWENDSWEVVEEWENEWETAYIILFKYVDMFGKVVQLYARP